MAKLLILFLLVGGFYLFYPHWDIYERIEPSSSKHRLVAKGYWTRPFCAEAATEQGLEDFRCRKRTRFDQFLNGSQRYSQGSID